MINEPPVHEHVHDAHQICCVRKISWTAIIIGAFVGVGLSFLINLFTFGFGLSSYTNTATGTEAFAIGGFIGLLIASIATMFATGWVAGYLARPYCSNRNLGALYGFAAWTLTLILSIILAGHLGDFLNISSSHIRTNSVLVPTGTNSMNPLAAPEVNRETVSDERAAGVAMHNIGATALIMFFLFFLGALASCVGGYFGILDRDLDRTVTRERPSTRV